jgi:membrane protease YdiL (CAAX protease family)
MDKLLKKMGFWYSLAIYIPASLLLLVSTNLLIPFLSRTTGQETIFYWFIVSGLGVFLPLVVSGAFILKNEGYRFFNMSTWKKRLRFVKPGKKDLLWSIGGIFVTLILSGLLMKGMELLVGKFDHSPPFMSFEPLSSGRYWLLLVWFPYWILNILGEEIIWRGVMLPRQELAFKKYAWLFHGFGWLLFHIAFGWQLFITLTPLMFIQSYVVVKTKNSWTGVIIHGGINGPSFIAIALGVL